MSAIYARHSCIVMIADSARSMEKQMKACGFVVAAGFFLAGAAQAQLLNVPPSSFQAHTLTLSKTQPFPLPYINSDVPVLQSNPLHTYRSDPKLVLGFDLTPNLGLEAGFANLYSRGFHYVDMEGRPDEREGVLGNHGFTSYLAAKLEAPVGERLSAYGKLGVAYSERETRDAAAMPLKEGDAGLYANMGARYKLTEKATVSGEYQRAGDSKKWGGDTNANGVGAKLHLGF
jgi:hypothetical protein